MSDAGHNSGVLTISHPWRGHWQEDAFLIFVLYMATDHAERFYAETGETFIPAKGGIDAMIDEATGANDALAQRFIDWCVKQYGTPEDIGA